MANEVSSGREKQKLTFLSLIGIQGAVIIYTGSTLCSKMASACRGTVTIFGKAIPPFTLTGYLWLFLEVCCLGVYAILWQQIIKRFDLSIAYCNRAFAVCWSFLWGVLLFGERVKPLNILGIAIVLAGILLVNQDAQ
jgi:drug/metabolite transporter (DMT)-like permease